MVAALTATASAQSRISWLTDWRQARDLAQQQNRLVLLHFWSETCAPCKRLEQHVFIQPTVANAMSSGYIPVKINVDREPQLAKHYKVTSWPTDIIVDPTGRIIHRQISPSDPNQYIALLDGVKANYSVTLQPTAQAVAANSGGQSLAGQPSPPRTNPRTSSYLQANQTPSRYGQQAAAPPSLSTPPANSPLPGAPSRPAQVGQPYANPYVQNPGSTPTPQPAATPNSTSQNINLSGGSIYGNPIAASNPQLGVAAQTNPPVPAPANGGNFNQTTQQLSAIQVATRPELSTTPTITIDGYCPVTLVEKNTWSKGDAKWGAVHLSRTYLFASYVNQQRFLANPDRFSPMLSGYDPIRYFDRGEVVAGRREHGLYYGEQFYLFSDENTLEQFRGNAQRYVTLVQQANQ
jgi:protein disulfide-isomerase